MDQEAATQFVIRELSRHRHRNDIIVKLCQVDAISWAEGEEFVSRVETVHRRRIILGQGRLVVFVGITLILGGIFIVLRYGLATLNGAVMFLPFLPIPYLGNIVRIGTGVGMILGGSIGILKVVWDFLS